MAKTDNLDAEIKPAITPQALMDAMQAVFSPVKEEKEDKKNRILVIDGEISDDFVSLKKAKKYAKQLATTDAKIQVYKLEGTLDVTLPVELK